MADADALKARIAAIGIEPDGSVSAPTGADAAPSAEGPHGASAETDPALKLRTPRAGTKQAKMVEMLRIAGGATIDEIVAQTGWQAHTVRGAMSGAPKKKLGLTITPAADWHVRSAGQPLKPTG